MKAVVFFVVFFLISLDICFSAEIIGDRIKPFVSARTYYDSNVFKVKDKEYLKAVSGDDRMSETINQLTVGASFNYKWSRQELEAMIKREFLRYKHYKEQNSNQDEFSMKLKLNFLDKVKATASENYRRALVLKKDFMSNQKNEQISDAKEFSIEYDLPSGFAIQGLVRTERKDFSLQALGVKEYTNNTYSGVLSYAPSPDSTFFASYHINEINYDKKQAVGGRLISNDSIGEMFKLGYNGKLGGKTVVSLSGGYSGRRYEEFSSRDFIGIIGKAQLAHQLTGKITLSAVAERFLQEEIFLDQLYSVDESVSLTATYKPTAKIETYLSGLATQKSFRGDSHLALTTFQQRSDRLNDLVAGVGWSPVQLLSLEMVYRFSERDSNYDQYKYKSHGLELGVSYKY
ncbi:MAG: outer membrane beta-barrel protein [Nitrospirae bacterium]|nr:outer membrane beta-barrel protein [Nitrospirota bacterium]